MEQKGYIFTDEYRSRVLTAKGKIKTETMKYDAIAIKDGGTIDFRERFFKSNLDEVQRTKAENYVRSILVLREAEADTIEDRNRLWNKIQAGDITSIAPQAGVPVQSEEYWRWYYFERNRETFLKTSYQMLPPELVELWNDNRIMYRMNMSTESLIHEYIYGDMAENNVESLLDIFAGYLAKQYEKKDGEKVSEKEARVFYKREITDYMNSRSFDLP